MSVQKKPSLNAASSTQTAPGSTRRSFVLTAAAAAASTLVQPEVSRAAIVQTDTAKLAPLPLPPGIRSRYVPTYWKPVSSPRNGLASSSSMDIRRSHTVGAKSCCLWLLRAFTCSLPT
jgi:hypothetical protein